MGHTSPTAAVVAAVVICGLGASPTAANAQAAAPDARAAWIKTCKDKDDLTYPCGTWKLVMRDGRTITVPGAAATRVDGAGRREYTEGLFSVSGDGRWIGYLRERDHRLVVRRASGGPVTELPASLTPRRLGTSDLAIHLSRRGERLVVDYLDKPIPGKIVTVRTGATVNLPAGELAQAFSTDGDELLTVRSKPDSTTALIVHRLGGGGPLKRTPPQVVAAAGVYGLAADGKTVAALIPGDAERGRRPRLREYDMETGELSPGVTLAVKPDEAPTAPAYDRDGGLDVHFYRWDEGTAAPVRVLGVDTRTGAVTQRDRYTISRTAYAMKLAGE